MTQAVRDAEQETSGPRFRQNCGLDTATRLQADPAGPASGDVRSRSRPVRFKLRMVKVRLYDTATREIRDFNPFDEGKVSIYVCGLTPQAEPHVGHLRSGVNFRCAAPVVALSRL